MGRVGGQIGDRVDAMGMGALKRFKNWSGFGDYNLSSNSLISSALKNGQTPQIQTQGREVRIIWREYISEVYTHPTTIGGFDAQTYTVNPGNMKAFPWLHTIANQYEQYKPNGIIFSFVSTATDTTTQASLGSVVIASDYDVNDQPYVNKRGMLTSAYSQESKMSENALHGIECDPNELQRKMFYTRNFVDPSHNPQSRDYDLCKTTIATMGGGLSAGESVGSLYVHYDFTFFKEEVYGGVLGYDVLYQTQEYLMGTNAKFRLCTPFEAGSVLTNGVDLGISCGQDGQSSQSLFFPRWMNGGVIKIQYELNENHGSGPSLWVAHDESSPLITTDVEQIGLSLVKPKNEIMVTGNPVFWQDTYLGDRNGAGPATGTPGYTFTTYVKIDTTVPTAELRLKITNFGLTIDTNRWNSGWPSAGSPVDQAVNGTWTVRATFTLMNSADFE